jgi:hypothetical protein
MKPYLIIWEDSMPDDLEFITHLFKRNKRAMLVMTLVFALVAIIIGLIVSNKPAAIGLGVAGGVASIICLVLYFRASSVYASLYPILQDHPERINLVYTTGMRYSTLGQELSRENIVGIRLENGRTFLLRSLRPHEVAKVLEILKRCAPQAKIGQASV